MSKIRVAVPAAVAFTGLLATFLSIPAADAGTQTGVMTSSVQQKQLLVRYDTKKACTVYPNYPTKGSPFVVPAGRNRIIWRYNVNGGWALVSDPVRAQKRQFPWWGFTRRDCIAGEPKRIQEGRSRVARSGWRPVRFTMPRSPIAARGRVVRQNATLRDPANFVVGNVLAGWHVDVTAKTRSNSWWIYVYVPNAKRWGYIERNNLS